MRRLLMLTVAILATLTVYAKNEKKVKSKISSVTVYREGAQITRTANVTVGKGKTTLVFDDLTHKVNASNIQIKASGGVTILSVKKSIKGLVNPQKIQVDKLNKEVEKLSDSISLIKRYIKNCNYVVRMVNSNKTVWGKKKINISELKDASEFCRQKIREIRVKEYNLKKLNHELLQKEGRIYSYIPDKDVADSIFVGVVEVTLSANKITKSNIQLRYIVNNAGWKPDYKIEVDEIDKPINLNYNAIVTQNTGESWNNVKLILSSGNPNIINSKPQIHPYYLNAKDIRESKNNKANNYSTFNNRYLEFGVNRYYTIQDDNIPIQVSIIKHNIPVKKSYTVIPKISSSVFIMASIANYEDLNLLSGNSRLFIKDIYKGNQYINVDTTNDTLPLVLGKERDIIVKRESIKKYTSRRVSGSYVKNQKAWRITIKNNKDIPVDLNVIDQYPISKIVNVDVNITEANGAKVDKLTGKLTWNIQLKPKEKREIEFKYIIKSPKNSEIEIE